MSSPKSPKRNVPMKVIVAALQRTGTLSTRVALHQLGFHECYHMRSVLANPLTHPAQWVNALESKFGDQRPFTKADWDGLLCDAQAVVDMPASLFAPELAELYPDAKVIIQKRDPEAWHRSVTNTIYKAVANPSLATKLQMLALGLLDEQSREVGNMFRTIGRLVARFDYGTEKDKAIQFYNDTYDEFRRRIPRDRWIEWSPQEGWGPLCAHLGVDVPMVEDGETGEMVEAPFPRTNDTAFFAEHVKGMVTERRGRALKRLYQLIGQATITGAVVYGGWKLYEMRISRFLS